MPVELRLIAVFALTAGGALVLTPLAMRLATRTAFFDHPLGYKGHSAPTPYLGGLAVILAFAAGTTLGTGLDRLWPLVAGALVLCALGTLDDRVTVRPAYRVAVEAALAAGLWALDLGWPVSSSAFLNLLITILWIVAVVNAFNLMDNMDGTATSCAIASALGIVALALITGQYGIAILALALAGSCLGFLPFNLRSPARIFLGDGGSMPIGFVAGGLAMAVPALDAGSDWVGLAGVLLVGLPLTDTTLVAISRRRRGVSILKGGRDHMTHRLLSRLGSARLVALALAAAQVSLALLAVVGTELGRATLAWISIACLLVAGATILALDEGTVAVSSGGHALEMSTPPTGGTTRARIPFRALVVGGLGLACGLSPLLDGFYSFSIWGPIALGMVALLFGLFVAGERPRGRLSLVALGGLVALAALALLSTSWAESADRALVEADRWMLYAAFFGVLLMVMRSDRVARVGLAAAATGLVGVTGYILVTMAAGGGGSLFSGGRLFEPLGYVNSEGLFLVLGFWPLAALAQYARHPAVAGLGAAGTTAMAGVAVLTQARGVALALVASVIVVLLFVPDRQRRAWLLLVVLAAVLAVNSTLLDVYQAAGRASFAEAIRDAGQSILLASATAGVLWGAGSALFGRLPAASVRKVSGVLLAVLAAGALLVVAVKATSISDRVQTEVKAFKNLNASVGRSRFLSGGGNRYDYWRIAVNEFRDQPVAGVGAGNYTRDYFLQRRTTEDIRQPHSIELQTLSELGLVGAIALALFLAGVAAGWGQRVRVRSTAPADRAMLVATGGIFSAWLAHTSVDWSHLIPGVAGVALLAAAYLVAQPRSTEDAGGGRFHRLSPPARFALRGALSIGIAVAAVAIARPVLAEHYRSQGQAALRSDPVRALAEANDSLALSPNSAEALYLNAAAYARVGDYARARSALLHIAALEPHNFVPWALLGDLAMRRGDLMLAQRCYMRGSQLNPRDAALQQLRRTTGS